MDTGMKLNDCLTLGAIVVGPTFAVAITLIIEKTRRTTERRLHIMRMLLATRHMPADASVTWRLISSRPSSTIGRT